MDPVNKKLQLVMCITNIFYITYHDSSYSRYEYITTIHKIRKYTISMHEHYSEQIRKWR